MTGFALATGCNLLLFPTSSRTVTFRDAAAYIHALQAALRAQSVYIQKLKPEDLMGLDLQKDNGEKMNETGLLRDREGTVSRAGQEAKALKGAVKALTAAHGKMYGDLPFAKREMALGYLDADDIDGMSKLLRSVMLSLVTMSTIVDIFPSVAKQMRRTHDEADCRETETPSSEKKDGQEELSDVLQSLQAPFKALTDILHEGLDHAAIQLNLVPKQPRTSHPSDQDLELGGDGPKPGSAGFVDHLESEVDRFYSDRGGPFKHLSHDADLGGAKSTSVTLEKDDADRQIRGRIVQQQMDLGLYVGPAGLIDLVQMTLIDQDS